MVDSNPPLYNYPATNKNSKQQGQNHARDQVSSAPIARSSPGGGRTRNPSKTGYSHNSKGIFKSEDISFFIYF